MSRTFPRPRNAYPDLDRKRQQVTEVFDRAAPKYDLMNDVLSFGLHRLFKRIALEYTGLRRDGSALDIAGGTGALATLLSRVAGRNGRVVLLDVNERMVRIGRDALIDAGCDTVGVVMGDAEAIPTPDCSFDAATIGFGLRNFSDRDRALEEAWRVLRPGGRLVVLEFASPPNRAVAVLAKTYRRTWPILGRIVSGNAFPYTYLAESIDTYPTQATLCQMLSDAGFKNVSYENLLLGSLSIHTGSK